MFETGSKVRMSELFAMWCQGNVNSNPSPNDYMKIWVSWIEKVLEVVSIETNSFDPNFLDLCVRPEYSNEKPLSISIFEDDFAFCHDKSIIPFILVNGIKLSKNKEDCCKTCGAPGKVVLMACVCSKCGQLVWGM